MTVLVPTLEQLQNKRWRLENLYWITDKNGNSVKFNLNWAQNELYDRFWYQMLILKARQLGVTTFFSISYLDDCFWYSNTSAGIIADKKESAEDIFKKKVKYAYDRMPEYTKAFNSATNDRVGELSFKNGSSYRVSTGFRSGTYQRLLISEFGKICAKSPDVAKEIVTGSLNTVGKDQMVVIESTAEGREGYFYDFSKESEALLKKGQKLAPMQMRFFFFPWFNEPSYREDHEDIIVTKETNAYLDKIEIMTSTKIDIAQRRWYELKQSAMQDNMKQEYPSTPEEAFEASNEGLYYGTQIAKLRSDKRITRVPYQPCSLVHTAWDIGIDDHTVIWMFQLGSYGEIQIIDYYENNNEGAKHYVDYLHGLGYTFGTHILPHDARNRSAITGNSYVDMLEKLLKGTIYVHEIDDIFNGIQMVRSILPRCVFDEANCSKGIKHLEAYKKQWNDKLGGYHNRPLHDEHSHCADSFRMLAQGIDHVGAGKLSPDKIKEMRRAHGYK